MKIVKSIVDQYLFVVSDLTFETVQKEVNDEELEELTMDIDFEFLIRDNNQRRVDITFDFRPEGVKAGYYITGKAQGFFTLTNEIVEDQNKQANAVLYTCFPMVISSVRSYIENLTSYSPYGKYTLPGIPIQDLINQKGNQMIELAKQNPSKQK